jgi:hypothetical protein
MNADGCTSIEESKISGSCHFCEMAEFSHIWLSGHRPEMVIAPHLRTNPAE